MHLGRFDLPVIFASLMCQNLIIVARIRTLGAGRENRHPLAKTQKTRCYRIQGGNPIFFNSQSITGEMSLAAILKGTNVDWLTIFFNLQCINLCSILMELGSFFFFKPFLLSILCGSDRGLTLLDKNRRDKD